MDQQYPNPNENPYTNPNENPFSDLNGNPYPDPNGNPYSDQNGNPYQNPNQNPQYGPEQMDPRMVAYQNYYQRGSRYNEKGKKIGNGLGKAALVLGVISLLFFLFGINLFTAVLAVVLGIIQLAAYDKKGFAIAGIACAVVSVALTIGSYSLIMRNERLVTMLQESFGNGTLQDELQDYLLEMDGTELVPSLDFLPETQETQPL